MVVLNLITITNSYFYRTLDTWKSTTTLVIAKSQQYLKKQWGFNIVISVGDLAFGDRVLRAVDSNFPAKIGVSGSWLSSV